jgi:tRNA-splicing ligase RtcB (3'-phosphate/5'-hydroxy nucleic acid ligase)
MLIEGQDLLDLGWEAGPAVGSALKAAEAALNAGVPREEVLKTLEDLRGNPEPYCGDAYFGKLASDFTEAVRTKTETGLFDAPIRYTVWGNDIDQATLDQMDNACRLPITVAAAQMPDGHVGYGLPIGGVLATRDTVIPYGVGVDIACRMKLSIIDEKSSYLSGWKDRLKKALKAETAFGIGAEFRKGDKRQHDVIDDAAWEELPRPLKQLRDKAWSQLGTSGSGNHFVEWGELVLDKPELGLPAGKYIALLSHSGSRGFGANVAKHFTDIAMDVTKLPKPMRHLAWLPLASQAGRDYWNAMELAGKYAAANHDLIHRHVLRAAGFEAAVQVENHHNFAWLEEHNGENVVVHRKGATPAGKGVLGVIPGSMGDPGFVVRGKGEASSLHSAAHGAGRRMSRKAAKESITRSEIKKYLADRGVELISAGVDEAPMAYKNIHEVMRAQSDLVEPVATFFPKIVLMAEDGKAED